MTKIRKICHVEPARGGALGWEVTLEGEDLPDSHHELQELAIAAARKLALRVGGNEIIVHKLDGSIQKLHAYDELQPAPEG